MTRSKSTGDAPPGEAALRHLNADLEQRVGSLTRELDRANRELQSLSYAISHDLRAPLRAISGFTRLALTANAVHVDKEASDNLKRVEAAAERMGMLISGLLELSRASAGDLRRQTVKLSELAADAAARLAAANPQRRVEFLIAPAISVDADRGTMQTVMEKLFDNAWKFTSRTEDATVEFGQMAFEGEMVCFVRDNGAGFDMRYADRLFGPFQRLHNQREFEGIGIGLSIVQRIVTRHGGSIRAESEPGKGATFYFSLGNAAINATDPKD